MWPAVLGAGLRTSDPQSGGHEVAPDQPDPDRYNTNAFCDVLVIGGGPAGRTAREKRAGERVLLVEQMPRLGAGDDEAAALRPSTMSRS